VLAVDVVPRAPDEEGDVVGEVEDRGDEGQAEKEEEDGVWRETERLEGGGSEKKKEVDSWKSVCVCGLGENSQKANFSQGVNMYTAKVSSRWYCLSWSHFWMLPDRPIVGYVLRGQF
jgi:hypothetical protein